jgi:hypothetical protein
LNNAIIGGLFAIVAVLIATLFVIRNSRVDAKRDIGKQLVETFTSLSYSFDKIALTNIGCINPLLRREYPELMKKVEIYKRYLSFWKKRGFENAWINYYNSEGNKGNECYHHYMPFGSEQQPPYRKDMQYFQNFYNNVDAILKYVQLK